MKKRLREKLLNKRDAIPPAVKLAKEAAIENTLFSLDEIKSADSLLLYASFRSEVNTASYIDKILQAGKKLILPLVDKRHQVLKLYEVKHTDELKRGYMGIMEPGKLRDRKCTLKDIDLAVIPGTGFDIRGNRLGYGGGYYDKLLSMESRDIADTGHVTTVAPAFEEQIVDDIPAEPHDIKVDIIITDRRVIRCS